jgi:hypothetical protein
MIPVFATNYQVLIHSFDDDYYYGTFLRSFSDGTRRFIANLHLDFEDQDENFPHSYLYFREGPVYAENLFTDFEVDDAGELEDKLSAIVMQHAHEIFQAIKQQGANWEMNVA